MTTDDAAFMRYLAFKTASVHPSFIPCEGPEVEMYDGVVKIVGPAGDGELRCRGVLPRQLRALATQLELVANELERRRFEK